MRLRNSPWLPVLLCLAALASACRPVPPAPDGLLEAIDLPGPLPERDADEALRHLAAGDAAWEERDDDGALGRAREAYWMAALADPALYDAYWKAARACIAVGKETGGRLARADEFERGSGIAALATDLEPARPEAHYYYAISLGLLANLRRSIAPNAVTTVLERLDRSAAIDPSFDHAGAYRALALIYVRAPKWPVSVGDEEAALEYARLAVDQAPDYPANQLALAEALIDNRSKEEAAAALQRAEELIASGPWPGWLRREFEEELAVLRKKAPAGS